MRQRHLVTDVERVLLAVVLHQVLLDHFARVQRLQRVQHHAILDVGATADPDRLALIAAHRGERPDHHPPPDPDIADHGCQGVDRGPRPDTWFIDGGVEAGRDVRAQARLRLAPTAALQQAERQARQHPHHQHDVDHALHRPASRAAARDTVGIERIACALKGDVRRAMCGVRVTMSPPPQRTYAIEYRHAARLGIPSSPRHPRRVA